jgi:signal transduction histidine kinase
MYHKRKQGIGIGLSLVKRIIDRYHGELWVEDRKDHNSGSNFIVLIPLIV